jgi:quinol monooxygenase YgiN
MMIVVSGVFEVDPSSREAAIEAAVTMAGETRKEAGCLSYAFYTDVEDPARIRVFEEWESAEALELHFRTAHMAEFRAALGRLQNLSGGVHRYVVTERAPLR